ncbi:MAG TPA: futalosine hydrolase [Candidatus Cybelea sp.]|nr:futalosine hydrolase [Candidatus Cybelea sp.]
MILLCCAVDAELRFWKDREGVDKLILGVGPVEAAAAVATAVANRDYSLVVNAGVGGALSGAAQIGDGVIVGADTMDLGLETSEPISLPPGERVVDRARSDGTIVGKLRARGFAVLNGVTVSSVTATDETASQLAGRGAQVESMEGFAVLRAAERAGVRAIELRGISNRCGARESSGWDFAAGAAGLQKIVEALFDVLDEGTTA